MELELERCPPNLPVSQDVFIPGIGDKGTGRKKTKGKKRGKSKEPDPEPDLEANANPKGKRKGKGKEKTVVPQPPREKPRPKPRPTAPPHERLKISMVHGDVLILSGGDYIVRHLSRFLRWYFDADPSNSAVYANANWDVYL